jgi:hypothetical protein
MRSWLRKEKSDMPQQKDEWFRGGDAGRDGESKEGAEMREKAKRDKETREKRRRERAASKEPERPSGETDP